MKHNNLLPNEHFRKDWQLRVKTWFNQPGQKKARRVARVKKAAQIAPRPIDGLLRPAVRGQTIKYNRRVRAGRGFTLDELKEAGITAKVARTIGISVDHRRKNRSMESLQLNVERLAAYKAKLVVFPKNANKPKKGDATKEQLQTVSQVALSKVFPIVQAEDKDVERVIAAGESKVGAYAQLRKARGIKRYAGIRAVRAAKAAEEEKEKK